MAKSSNQKAKILYLLQLLEKKSDEQHPVGTKEIISYLDQQGISAERKTVYADIRTLTDFGYDIEYVKSGTGGGYYLASRDFGLPELKLLVDLVQSAKFITTRKSREFIKKLEALASEYDARSLQRQVYVANRVKTDNESIYDLVDEIHRAVSENFMISFQYYEITVDKKEKFKKDGARYLISPWALTWNDDCYYMIGYDDQAELIKHYRVDRMHDIRLSRNARLGAGQFKAFDLAAYCQKTFHMFAGVEERVQLEFSDRLSGVVFDRFGMDITVHKLAGNRFSIAVPVMVSNQFFGWMAGLGPEARILTESIAQQYCQYLLGIVQSMDQKEAEKIL